MDFDATVLGVAASRRAQAAAPVAQAPQPQPSAEPTPEPQAEARQRPSRPSNQDIPKVLSSTDVVPEFRAELQLARLQGGGYNVSDPTTGRSIALNEFEVSLARMLNGRRRMFEILEASSRLGIPINLESLQKFITQLDHYGFLGKNVAATEAKAWPTRGEWESSVRGLFQSGIRQLRMGKYAEAAGYFEAMLQADPDNIEAIELLAMAEKSRDAELAGQPVMQPAMMMQPQMMQPQMMQPQMMQPQMMQPQMMQPQMMQPQMMQPQMMQPQMMQPDMQQPQMMQPPPPMMSQPMMAQPMPMLSQPMMAQPMPMTSPPPQAARGGARFAIIGAAVALCVAVGGFLIWRTTSQTAEAVPPTNVAIAPPVTPPVVTPPVTPPPVIPPVGSAVAPITSPTGSDAAVAITPGSAAPTPTPTTGSAAPITPPTTPTTGSAAPITPPITPPRPPVAPPKPNVTPPVTPPRPKVASVKIQAPSAGEVNVFLRGARNVQQGEKLFEIIRVTSDPAKTKDLEAKVADMEKLAKDDPGTYDEFLAKARADLAAAKQVSTTVVKAPRAGKAEPRVKQGASVHAGETLAELQ